MNTIKINGSYENKFPADYILVYLTVNHKFKTYEECINDSKYVSKRVYDLINKSGFNNDDLVLTNFQVLPNNESYYEDDIYKTKQNGFAYTNNYKLGMDLNFELLGNLLNNLEKNSDDISFNITFTLKNDELAKNKVLKYAIKECEKKARLIAKQTNKELGDIINIEYESFNNNYERPVNFAVKANSLPSFKPNDISVRENIVITYEIK